MQAEESPLVRVEPPLLDPIAILTQELNNKAIKKAAVESVGTIALVLSPDKVQKELAPLLIRTFVQENTEMRVTILRAFLKLLQFVGEGPQVFPILEFVIDVLCVFSEEEIRKEATLTFEAAMKAIRLSDTGAEIRRVYEQLRKEKDKKMASVVLKLSRHLYCVAGPDEQASILKHLQQSFTGNQQELLILANQLMPFINQIPSFPLSEIQSMLKTLITSNSNKVKCSLVDPLLLLAEKADKDTAKEHLLQLLRDPSSDVIASVVLKTSKILALFPEPAVQQELWKIVDAYSQLDITLKTAIIEVLEEIPLTPQRREALFQGHNWGQSLNLNKTFASSLCKVGDIEGLRVMIESSDTEFKNKLFPKLPATCELHLELMGNLFSQKNWRNKLTLLQNVERRLQQGEAVEILVPKLLQQMGDKIAVFRMAVVKLVGKILKTKRVELQKHRKSLEDSLNSRNWFQRQATLLLLQEKAEEHPNLTRGDRQIIAMAVRQGAREKIENIREIARQIGEKLRLKLD